MLPGKAQQGPMGATVEKQSLFAFARAPPSEKMPPPSYGRSWVGVASQLWHSVDGESGNAISVVLGHHPRALPPDLCIRAWTMTQGTPDDLWRDFPKTATEFERRFASSARSSVVAKKKRSA